MGLIDEIKSVAKVVQQAGNYELYKQIADLQFAAMDLLQENRDLKEEINKLNEKLTIKDKLYFENDAYWIKNDTYKNGPFCSRCWDVENKVVRLHKSVNGHRCPSCQTFISKENDSYEPMTFEIAD